MHIPSLDQMTGNLHTAWKTPVKNHPLLDFCVSQNADCTGKGCRCYFAKAKPGEELEFLLRFTSPGKGYQQSNGFHLNKKDLEQFSWRFIHDTTTSD